MKGKTTSFLEKVDQLITHHKNSNRQDKYRPGKFVFEPFPPFLKERNEDFWLQEGFSELQSRVYAKLGEMAEGDEQEQKAYRYFYPMLCNEDYSIDTLCEIVESNIKQFYKDREEGRDPFEEYDSIREMWRGEDEEDYRSEDIDGMTYGYYLKNNGATIRHISGFLHGHVSITDNIHGYPITAIGKNVFANESSITSISLPEGITSIGESAFEGCGKLTDISLPSSLKVLGDYAFSYCSSLKEIRLPEGVTSIGKGAFAGCSSFTTIVVPKGITSISKGAFRGCQGLVSIDIPEWITVIDDEAFRNCFKLEHVTLPEGLTIIGSYAFNGCRNLKSIHIPKGVQQIGAKAFKHCELETVTVPTTTKLCNAAFWGTHVVRSDN